jgi:peptide/nickel transport system substrate-binding protein
LGLLWKERTFMIASRSVGIFLVLLVLGFLPQARAETVSASRAKYGGQLIYGSRKDIAATNPFRNTSAIDYEVRSLIFEGLTGLDKEGNVVPCLAKSWEVSKDGLTYTFVLRSGAKFHNGKKLTAEDVKWSMDYMREPKNRAYLYPQLRDVRSVEAPDPVSVVFTLKAPFSPFATAVSTTRAPVIPAGSQLSPEAFPPGTGPYQFVEWQQRERLSLRAFREYWVPGVPYMEGVVFKPIIEDNVKVIALRAREIDILDEVPYSAVAEARKSKSEFHVVPYEAAFGTRIVLNTRVAPLDDVRVRQAIAYAIDKRELAEGQMWGVAKPTNQLFPAVSKWFVELKDREQDLSKARSLLAEAGFKDGLKIKAPVYPGPDMDLTVVLKDQLKKVGIELELDVMDWAAHSKRRVAKEFTVYAAGKGSRPDPDQFYYDNVHSKSPNNESGYSDPRVDQLLEKARQVYDFKERKRLYSEVLKSVQNDVPEIYLFMGPKFLGVQPYVKGFSPGSFQDKFSYMGGGLAYAWIEK